MRIGLWDPEKLGNSVNNIAFTRRIIEQSPVPENYKDFLVYECKIKNSNLIIFVKGEMTQAFFAYSIDKNNNFVEEKVWQDMLSLGVCRDILFNYFLSKFNGIISDSAHSQLGERYWIKLVDAAISKGYNVYVIFDDNKPTIKLNSSKDMAKFYGPISIHSRFLITKK
jgi:hypothetical protein